MLFPVPLVPGTLIQRYKRFLADVFLDSGETITATCPNTGSMLGLTTPGTRIWLSASDSPTRKYRHTWELVEVDLGHGPSLVGINTGRPNKLVAGAIAEGKLRSLAGYQALRHEVKYGRNSRVDILLEDPVRGSCYVEVKNVHMMRRHGLAEFPDCVTERGVKHLAELTDMVRQGHRAVMVYLVQRADASRFAFAEDLDPTYAAAFAAAHAAGVEAIAVRCRLSPHQISVEKEIPIASAAKRGARRLVSPVSA